MLDSIIEFLSRKFSTCVETFLGRTVDSVRYIRIFIVLNFFEKDKFSVKCLFSNSSFLVTTGLIWSMKISAKKSFFVEEDSLKNQISLKLLHWKLDSPKIPKSSISVDTFRHSNSCLAVTANSNNSIENFVFGEENWTQKKNAFSVLVQTSDSLKIPKFTIKSDAAQGSSSFFSE